MTNGHPWRGAGARPSSSRTAARALGPLGRSRLGNGFACTILSTEGDHHGDIGRANESAAGTERRGLRRLTIGVSEDDLRVIAKHGYEGAASTDHDQQAQAVGLFITDKLAASIAKITALRRSQRRSVTQ